jgi:hypothetical protein
VIARAALKSNPARVFAHWRDSKYSALEGPLLCALIEGGSLGRLLDLPLGLDFPLLGNWVFTALDQNPSMSARKSLTATQVAAIREDGVQPGQNGTLHRVNRSPLTPGRDRQSDRRSADPCLLTLTAFANDFICPLD